jgi:hypothetical protein
MFCAAVSVKSIIFMKILARDVVVISNEDLKPSPGNQQYAELNAAVIAALEPHSQDDGTQRFAILRVEPETRAFKLPEACTLLALEGKATVQATGGCGIWYCEGLELKADLAVLGAGRPNRLECDEVSLLSRQEVKSYLEDLVHLDTIAPRVAVQSGHVTRISLISLADDDAEMSENSLSGIEAEFEVLGDFTFHQLDKGILLRGAVDLTKGASSQMGESESNGQNQARRSLEFLRRRAASISLPLSTPPSIASRRRSF